MIHFSGISLTHTVRCILLSMYKDNISPQPELFDGLAQVQVDVIKPVSKDETSKKLKSYRRLHSLISYFYNNYYIILLVLDQYQ